MKDTCDYNFALGIVYKIDDKKGNASFTFAGVLHQQRTAQRLMCLSCW